MITVENAEHILIILLVSAFFGTIVSGLFKTNMGLGFLMGFLFGPFGWILAALLPKSKPPTQQIPYRIPTVYACQTCGNAMHVDGLERGRYECRKCGRQFCL